MIKFVKTETLDPEKNFLLQNIKSKIFYTRGWQLCRLPYCKDHSIDYLLQI